MSTAALTNLWNFIQGMSLSDRNKQWLADRLIESKTSSRTVERDDLAARIERGRSEIRSGKCTTCTSKEELNQFLEAL